MIEWSGPNGRTPLVRSTRRWPAQDEVQVRAGLNRMSVGEPETEFVICIANKGYDDLDVWKVYRVVPDATATEVGCLRVVDESGEDYLYPADCFLTVDFPKAVRERLAAVATN